jgi:hypothetical protein
MSGCKHGFRSRSRFTSTGMMARPETEQERNPLCQTGERISLDRGFGQSSKIRGSILFAGLASAAQRLRQKDQSAHGRSSENNVVLLGHCPKRVFDRHSVQERGSLKRTLPTIIESQHTVLWRQRSHELSREKDPALLRRRNR